jgi:hypothetical protein
MKKISLIVLALFFSTNLFATISLKIQNEDVKTLTELTNAGGSMSQLINDSKIYVTGLSLNEQLSSAISNGDIFSLKAQGSSALKGLVTLVPGTNITLTQVGQNITIDSTGGGGGSSTAPSYWSMTGGVTVGVMDGPDVADTSKSVSKIVCSLRNSGSSGSTIVTFYYGPSLASSTTLTLTANSNGLQYNTATPSITLSTGDYIDAQVTQVAVGQVEDLRCKVIY